GATNTHDPEQQQFAHGKDTVQYCQYIAFVEKPNGFDIGHSALPTCFGSAKGCNRCYERAVAQKLRNAERVYDQCGPRNRTWYRRYRDDQESQCRYYSYYPTGLADSARRTRKTKGSPTGIVAGRN